MTTSPKTQYLKDYIPPTHGIENVHLHFELGDEATHVTATTKFQRNATASPQEPLRLAGCDKLKLLSISLDGRKLSSKDYILESDALTIPNASQQMTLEIVTE